MGQEAEFINWVSRRAECTSQSVFEAMIKRMSQDIEIMSDIVADSNNCRFHIVPDDGGEQVNFIRKSIDSEVAILFVSLCQNQVNVKLPNEKTLVVTQRWDSESAQCVLEVDGKEQELWQISQIVLLDFFFEKN